jgi:hypothetical protein
MSLSAMSGTLKGIRDVLVRTCTVALGYLETLCDIHLYFEDL